MSMPAIPFLSGGAGGGFGIQGSPSVGWTFTKTAEAGSAENILTLRVGDGLNAFARLRNYIANDDVFTPCLELYGYNSVGPGGAIVGQIEFDVGTLPALVLEAKQSTSGTVVNRPLVAFRNNASDVLSLLPLNSGANAALSWGAQVGGVPAFTARSAGTRLVLASAIDGSNVDYAIGAFGGGTAGVWYSVPRAIAGFEHRFYAGTDNVATIRGDGLMTTTGGKVKKVRIALTSPVTIAVTDDVVIVDLTTPGAVTINYPATPEAGREYVVIDGKGDSGSNNHTHTPAAGNINGAATAVVAANYYRRTAVYDGSQWLLG